MDRLRLGPLRVTLGVGYLRQSEVCFCSRLVCPPPFFFLFSFNKEKKTRCALDDRGRSVRRRNELAASERLVLLAVP